MKHRQTHLSPQPHVRHRVQRDVPHPFLLAVARQAEADGLDLRVRLLERSKTLCPQVLLRLHLDGVDTVRPLNQEVNLPRGVLGGPVIRRKPAVGDELLADVLLGKRALELLEDMTVSLSSPAIAPSSPTSTRKSLNAVSSA